jgi:hypothetical protein
MESVLLDDGRAIVSSSVATGARARAVAAMFAETLRPVARMLLARRVSSATYLHPALGWLTLLWARSQRRLEIAVIRPRDLHRFASGYGRCS